MQVPLISIINIFKEDRDIKMNELFKKAKNSLELYYKFIDEVEHSLKGNPEDKLSRFYVAKLRQILWPENQYAKEPSLLQVIPKEPSETKETFKRLKTEDNYKKVTAYFEGIKKSPVSAAAQGKN